VEWLGPELASDPYVATQPARRLAGSRGCSLFGAAGSERQCAAGGHYKPARRLTVLAWPERDEQRGDEQPKRYQHRERNHHSEEERHATHLRESGVSGAPDSLMKVSIALNPSRAIRIRGPLVQRPPADGSLIRSCDGVPGGLLKELMMSSAFGGGQPIDGASERAGVFRKLQR